MSAPAKHMLRSAAETVALLAPLVALLTCAYLQIEQSGLLTLLVGCAALAVFFCGFEAGKPALRQIMPTATLGGIGSSGTYPVCTHSRLQASQRHLHHCRSGVRQAQRLHGGGTCGAVLQLLLRTGTVDALADVCLGIGRIRCRRIGKQRRICVERTAWCPWSQLGNRRSALLWLSVRIGLRLHPEQLVYRGIPGTGNVARGAGSLPGRPAARLGP